MRIPGRYISVTALYPLLLTVLLTAFFELWRFILMLVAAPPIADIPAPVLFNSYLIGLRFDFRVACGLALLLLPFTFIPGLDITRSRRARLLHFSLLTLAVDALFLLHLADVEFFRYFNTRLNGSALLWKDTPGDVSAMIWNTYPVLRWLLLWLGMTLLFLYLARRLLRALMSRIPPPRPFINILWTPFILAVLIVGSIGRLYQVAPMRWGLAYHSEYDFANQLALNPAEQFLRDVYYDAGKREQVERLVADMHDPAAAVIASDLLGAALPLDSTARIVRSVRYSPSNDQPPNVILIIMESFAATKIGCLRSAYPYDLSPAFDSIAAHGILFTECYSAGTHTYSGLFTSLYGVPHLFGKLIMKQVGGHGYFHGLPTILRNHGYRTSFYTTQDPHFDNMQGFLRAHGVQDVCGLFDYDRTLDLSWLGVPDHVMFDTAYSRLRRQISDGRRTFATLLTSSNHAPWFYPDVPFARVPDSEPRAKELNAFKYADYALGRFLRQLVDDPVFDNTLIVVTADNGFPWQPVTDLDLTLLQIPLLLLSTDSNVSPGVRSSRLASQFDILPTVMGRLRLDYENYSFGKDLLDSSLPAQDFVLASRWYEVGFIQDSTYLITRRNGGADSFFHLRNPAVDLKDSLPDLFRDRKRKALALYQTAFRQMYLPPDTTFRSPHFAR